MFCPGCLAEYRFRGFEVDPDTLEHRGLFKCECEDSVVFSERELKDFELLTDDQRVRLRQHKLMIMREELRAVRKRETLRLTRHNSHILIRYLEEVAQKYTD